VVKATRDRVGVLRAYVGEVRGMAPNAEGICDCYVIAQVFPSSNTSRPHSEEKTGMCRTQDRIGKKLKVLIDTYFDMEITGENRD